MSIRSYTREQIIAGIDKYTRQADNRVRILFAGRHIREFNFDAMCKLYANIKGEHYDDVIIIEAFPGDHPRLLPMVSEPVFVTPLGEVAVNDALRNDFCDEDDDFYIDDAGFSDDMAIHEHLMMLQCTLDNFRVLSIQIVHAQSSIVRELANAIAELMRDRNALIIFCADASGSSPEQLKKLKDYINGKSFSRIKNYLNTGDAGITDSAPISSGSLTAAEWELETHLYIPAPGEPVCLSGYAQLRSRSNPAP
ncbi:AmmeMemoRadiSam system protein B [Cyclonatronum proteinivorum]|uniref:AmmeMemoRadiSam system protein B n=1 Tax=Cyclonatronum proteinivorum TaxID=1457365 RepID=A0A345UIV3_9BACT|nr:AmmeMemoRadiSam system protein B [Cyclonatronum proteinivorum]AXJ00405.1 AmmeMemoRadiSam system protein B [Cyclonatronum proteinivorum]